MQFYSVMVWNFTSKTGIVIKRHIVLIHMQVKYTLKKSQSCNLNKQIQSIKGVINRKLLLKNQ